jgi:hypothetical protein
LVPCFFASLRYDTFSLKTKASTSTHKKVVIELVEKTILRGYLNPTHLPHAESLDLLSPEGTHEEVPLAKVRAIYFVRDLGDDIHMERKSFLSRPKLDGLWVRLRFRDGESLEGVIPNDLLTLQDNGLQLTPPDSASNTDRIFVPRSALTEVTVLGVVGIARRKPAPKPAPKPAQPRLFGEEEET